LLLATRLSNLEIVKYLVDEAGADLMGPTRINSNIFHSAAIFNGVKILDYAISKKKH